jgi:hypothetical protein
VKAAARGPGVAAVGFLGGGEGDCSFSGCVVDVILMGFRQRELTFEFDERFELAS